MTDGASGVRFEMTSARPDAVPEAAIRPAVAAALVPLAWLLPNHYAPWPSAWQDGLALGLTAVVAWLLPAPVRLSKQWASVAAIAATVAVLQASFGLVHFAGDALTVVLYLCAFVMAVAAGRSLASGGGRHGSTPLDVLMVGLAVGAVLSVAIAFAQWGGVNPLGVFIVDLPPGARPSGNVAQPNHLCTIAFAGLCAACFLHQAGRLGRAGFGFVAAILLAGMVISTSRTGWLQIELLALLAMTLGARSRCRLGYRGVLVLAGGYAIGVLVWPLVNEALQLSSGRSLVEQTQAGTRWLHWPALVDAIAREPLWGYGWHQVGVAQQSVAMHHPSAGEHIEHSHNLLLDLMLWNGIPLGALLVVLIGHWFWKHLSACRDPGAAWLLVAIGGVLVHAMLEYPVEYAYFLVPTGLLIGAVGGIVDVERVYEASRWAMRTMALAFGGMLLWVAAEYLAAEMDVRTLRLESARIGSPGVRTPAPDLLLLTQLEALLQFVRTDARAGMSAEEVDSMRRVSERFGTPPMMLRYALATGLNGRPDLARGTLARLCRIHPRPLCEQALQAWEHARTTSPVLAPMTDAGLRDDP